MTPSPTTDQPRTHDERKIGWISLGFSAPWLIFLGYIYDGVLEPNAPVWKHVYVIICLVIFSITDVAAYTVPGFFRCHHISGGYFSGQPFCLCLYVE